MSTKSIVKNKPARTRKTTRKHESQAIINAPLTFETLPVIKIAFSPLNYRKMYSEADLEAFAGEIAQHGIISPLTVRRVPKDRYELVAGERRLRAALLAKLDTVPVIIREYTDEQTREIQLAENLQRENPHPLHEAFAIGQMHQMGKTIEDIAGRLGKSKQFVYVRLKLLALIEPIAEMFLHNVISIKEANAIATIAADSQTEFYKLYCRDWKKKKGFEITNLSHKLDQFSYDLKEAPFNTRDKNLIASASACVGCSFNTATHKSLFPELARQSVCTNTSCYSNKCSAHLSITIAAAIVEHQPVALIYNGEPSEQLANIVQAIKAASELATYDRYDITVMTPPEKPAAEDYTDDDEEENGLDEEAFQQAMEEYQEELELYETMLGSGKLQKGLFITATNIRAVAFHPEKQSTYSTKRKSTGKDVAAAIKAGTVTVPLLQAEIERLNSREERATELDREKIQLAVHTAFIQSMESHLETNAPLTDTDLTAARLMVYQSLDYSSRKQVDETLFPEDANDSEFTNDHFYEQLAALNQSQYAYLIRMALACKADSKYPKQLTALVLYKTAAKAGIEVAAIENAQQQKAITRQQRQAEKIKQLEKQIQKLQSKS